MWVRWCAESLFQAELVVAVMMPLLKGKSEALVMEKFGVELVVSLCRDEDDLKIMGALCVAGAGEALRLSVNHRADLKK